MKRLHSSARVAALFGVVLALLACSTAPPEGLQPVTPFEIQRYTGRWYEIARLDHRFERGLSDITAQYSPLPDGGIEVRNRGFHLADGEWREAVGHARFRAEPAIASLEVSFFGPFRAGYHVVALDREHYRWALVVGSDRDYFWILAREPELPPALREDLLAQARAMGIAVERLIWVEHGRAGAR